MRNKTTIVCAAAALALCASAAHADPLSDCKSSKNNEARIKACGEAIAAPGAPAQDKAEAYRARGDAFSDRAAHREAVADYTDALRFKGDDSASYYGRGAARLALNDVDGAIADFTQAIRYNSSAAGLYIARGYAQLVKNNPDEAIADFSVAIRLDPKNAGAFNNRGLAYRKKGDLDNALKDYSAAITLNPIYPLAYNNRGYVLESKGDKNGAAADQRRALELDPSLVGAKNALKRLGEPETVSAETDKLISQGRAIAERNCAWCHAIGADGNSPNPRAPRWRDLYKRHPIQALRDPLTRGIARPHDEMPKFQLSDQETDMIIAYINSLNP
jgi:tetratricopeptide (TPR) repeat protein